MIVAGIDEAGYGPLLGPLVVGCCALELRPDADTPVASVEEPRDLPCVWKRLKKLVSKTRVKSGQKLHINDSKQVYSPSIGLKELERSLLALLAAGRDWPGDLDRFLEVAAACKADAHGYPWYRPAEAERFPLEQDALPVQLFAKGLRAEMERTGCRLVHLHAKVTFERQLNRMFDATRNKASTLFSIAATHLDHLMRTYGDQDLTIFCDRQGGREHYGPLLRLMFEDWSLQILRESESRAEYLMHREGTSAPPVRIIFAEKAEAQCMPVALASMLSKYLRESLMRRYNAWWKQHLPNLTPTAGYYSDGTRFLADIEQKRRELGVEDGELIRSR